MNFRILCICLLLSCMSARLVLGGTLTVNSVVSVGKSPQRAVMTPNGAEVYVTNFNDSTVSVINTATNAVSLTLSVGGSPLSLAVSPDGSNVYVGNNAGGISIINTATKMVTTIATPGPVRDLALTPEGTKLYLAMEFSGLWQLSTATNSLSQVSSTVCPEGLAVAADGSTLYVNYQCGGPGGSAGHDAIGMFSVMTNAFLGSITRLPNVGEVTAISPNGLQLWENGGDACSSPAYDHVGCPASPGVPESVVNVIRTADNTLVRSLGGVGGYMSFFPNGSRVFLVVGNNLEIIDTSSFAIVDTVAIPASGSVVFTPDGSRAYAPVPSQNQVAVLTLCTPPVITDLSTVPDVLWPPNHKMIPVNVSGVTSGGCGAVSCKIISVSSNEPVDADGDWMIAGDLTLDLRAERLGTGTGRAYAITVQCTDGSGNSSTRTVAVTVPHDQGKR